jgi:hypothetical protein
MPQDFIGVLVSGLWPSWIAPVLERSVFSPAARLGAAWHLFCVCAANAKQMVAPDGFEPPTKGL